MTVSGFCKTKKNTLIIQTIDIVFATIANIILSGVSGAIINCVSIIRNILCYKNKFTLPVKIIITIITIGLSITFNNKGLIGLLPLISNISYTFLMDKFDEKKFKLLIIFTLIWWGIYDFIIHNYVAFSFDMATIVTSIIAIIRQSSHDTDT